MQDNIHEMAIKMPEQVKGVSVYIDGRYVNALDVSAERKHLETPDGVVFLEHVNLTIANIKDIAYIMNKETFEKFCKLWREYHVVG